MFVIFQKKILHNKVKNCLKWATDRIWGFVHWVCRTACLEEFCITFGSQSNNSPVKFPPSQAAQREGQCIWALPFLEDCVMMVSTFGNSSSSLLTAFRQWSGCPAYGDNFITKSPPNSFRPSGLERTILACPSSEIMCPYHRRNGLNGLCLQLAVQWRAHASQCDVFVSGCILLRVLRSMSEWLLTIVQPNNVYMASNRHSLIPLVSVTY